MAGSMGCSNPQRSQCHPKGTEPGSNHANLAGRPMTLCDLGLSGHLDDPIDMNEMVFIWPSREGDGFTQLLPSFL